MQHEKVLFYFLFVCFHVENITLLIIPWLLGNTLYSDPKWRQSSVTWLSIKSVVFASFFFDHWHLYSSATLKKTFVWTFVLRTEWGESSLNEEELRFKESVESCLGHYYWRWEGVEATRGPWNNAKCLMQACSRVSFLFFTATIQIYDCFKCLQADLFAMPSSSN